MQYNNDKYFDIVHIGVQTSHKGSFWMVVIPDIFAVTTYVIILIHTNNVHGILRCKCDFSNLKLFCYKLYFNNMTHQSNYQTSL